jgi:hypothetical protein
METGSLLPPLAPVQNQANLVLNFLLALEVIIFYASHSNFLEFENTRKH